MRVSVLIFLLAAALPWPSRGETPRPGGAALAKAAAELCRVGEERPSGADAADALKLAGAPAVAPLVTAMSSPEGCAGSAAVLLGDILCAEQARLAPGAGVTPALGPVWAALASSDRQRVGAGLAAIRKVGARTPEEVRSDDIEWPRRAGPRRCPRAVELLRASLPPLERLLKRTTGPRRQEVLSAVESLDLGEDASPLVAALVPYLDDEDLRLTTAKLLSTIGSKAAPAGRRLAQLSAQAAGEVCSPLPTFPPLFRAAQRIAPPPGRARDRWQADLADGARTALAALAPPCNLPHVEIQLQVMTDLATMPLTPDSQAALEAVMTDASRSHDLRHAAAWALQRLQAHLSLDSTEAQKQLLDPPVEPQDTADCVLPTSVPAGRDDPLPKSAVVHGMNAVKGKIADCYARFQTPGMAMVNVVIARDGRVSSATATGRFAGTPTGACVEAAVKTATFPPSVGLVTPFPFQLK